MRPLFLALLGMTLVHSAFSQTVAYVTPAGAGAKDGSSWANACDSKAFALAVQAASNTQYWVATGTYYPSCDASGHATPADPRAVCWSVSGSNVSVYGGFAGTETALSQRNIRTNPTIFSGDIGTAGDHSDNSYHVWNLSNSTGPVRIDGCTVTAGNANSPGYSSSNPDDFGGGIRDHSNQPVTIDNCLITDNSAAWGGGGDFGYPIVNMTNDVISNNTCYDGTSYGSGGGIQIEDGSVLTATQCVFANNDAGGAQDEGGGGLTIFDHGTAATLIQCTFFNNTSASTLRPGSGSVSMDAAATLTLDNTLIWANEATTLYTAGATVTAQHTIVKGLYHSPSWMTEAFLFADSSNPAGPDGQWRTADDGLALKTCSPAINKGNNGLTILTADITNQPRIYNSTVDIGAYEFQAVNPIVTPSLSITPNPAAPCAGQLIQWTSTVGGGGTSPLYQWQVNGKDVGNSATFSNSSLVSGDVVSCTMTSTDACDYGATATAPDTIRLVRIPSLSIRATDNGVCAGSPISISANLVAPGADPVLQWSVNAVAGGSSGLTYTSSQLQNGDLITCTLTPGTGACGTGPILSNAVTAVIYPFPSVSISPADTSVVYGTSLMLTADTSADVTSLQWTPTGSTTPNMTVVAETTEQTYTLTVQTAQHCSAEAKARVNVYLAVRMPSGFTPNGDGHNDVYRIPPGIQLNLQGFSVYDRQGTRVFYTQNPDTGWDGTVGGHLAPTGAYVYVLQGSNDQGPVNMKGAIMLIR